MTNQFIIPLLLTIFGSVIVFGVLFFIALKAYYLGKKHGYDDCLGDIHDFEEFDKL